MTNISNNGVIIMNRGDHLQLPVFINAGDELDILRYKLQKNDKLYISIQEPNGSFEYGIIRKILTKDSLNVFGDAVFTLETSDTENVLPGTYYYEIKLLIHRNNNDYLSTIVPKRKFILL